MLATLGEMPIGSSFVFHIGCLNAHGVDFAFCPFWGDKINTSWALDEDAIDLDPPPKLLTLCHRLKPVSHVDMFSLFIQCICAEMFVLVWFYILTLWLLPSISRMSFKDTEASAACILYFYSYVTIIPVIHWLSWRNPLTGYHVQ